MELTKLGDYQIVRRIGQGGMGAVYEGLSTSIGRRVAIKILLPEYAHHKDVVRRFFNEAKAVNAINHPGVVQVSEVGTAPDGSLYLVMEYLEGPTLAERLTESQGRLTEEEAITITWQLAGVLTAAHSKNIVHRDLKPGNIMLVPDIAGPGGERVKLLDFGIAKLGSEHQQGEDLKTRTGQTLGTASYMSPEQFMGRQTVDAQTDVYSLGVVMFRMLAGRVPFISTNGEMALGMMHLTEPPPLLTEFAPDASAWLAELINRMLAKQAPQRPTMAEVAVELQAHLPFRASSRSLPILGPLSGSHPSLKKVNLSPDNQPGISKEQPLVTARPLPLGESSSTGPVAAPASSSQSGAGTITRASGQRSLTSRLVGSLFGSIVVIALAVLALGSIGLYLLWPGRHLAITAAGAPLPNSASPGQAGAAAGANRMPDGAAATPDKAKGAPAEPGTSIVNNGLKADRDTVSRLSQTGKPSKKNDAKYRRAPKSAPTPIID